MFGEQIMKEKQYIIMKIKQMEEKIRELPDGKLVCTKNGKNSKWYIRDGQSFTYLPKKERDYAVKMAKKKYYSACMSMLTQRVESLENCMNAYQKSVEGMEVFWEKNPGIKELLEWSEKHDNDEMQEWANAEYDTNTAFPEHLNHRTPWGEVFRSKSEAMIARCLRERGIAYRYECALTLGNETFYPDFTIIHPRTKQVYYYEHYGRMDDPKYIRDKMPKLTTYANHGIIPGIHLILSFETQEEPLSMYTIESLLDQYFG